MVSLYFCGIPRYVFSASASLWALAAPIQMPAEFREQMLSPSERKSCVQTGCLRGRGQLESTRVPAPELQEKLWEGPQQFTSCRKRRPLFLSPGPKKKFYILCPPPHTFLSLPYMEKTASPPAGGSWKASQEAGHQGCLSCQSSEAAKLVHTCQLWEDGRRRTWTISI